MQVSSVVGESGVRSWRSWVQLGAELGQGRWALAAFDGLGGNPLACPDEGFSDASGRSFLLALTASASCQSLRRVLRGISSPVLPTAGPEVSESIGLCSQLVAVEFLFSDTTDPSKPNNRCMTVLHCNTVIAFFKTIPHLKCPQNLRNLTAGHCHARGAGDFIGA